MPGLLSRAKRRPPIRAIVVLMLLIAVATPMAGLFGFRVFENQLVRRTEGELVAQAAALAALMAREAAALPPGAFGAEAPAPRGLAAFAPSAAALDLADDLLPPRPEAPAAAPRPGYAALGRRLDPLLAETERLTLAGLQALDPAGTVLTGREAGRSLADVEEVAEALAGRLSARLRARVRERPTPLVYDVTKGANVRVHVAFPVIVEGRVAGAIYAARTPAHVLQVAWEERRALALAAGATLAAVLLLGFVATRAVTQPIRALTERTRAVAAGDRAAMRPLRYHGTAEVAELSETFLKTARRLHDRSESLAAFAAHVAHELKSPLTAIQGAAELVREAESEMPPETRRAFLDNIAADAARMAGLVRRLLELARAEAGGAGPGAATARAAAASIRAPETALSGAADLPLAIPPDRLAAALAQLAENAARAGATRLRIDVAAAGGRARLRVSDDGPGISAANREKVFDPFFTTRRAEGGTGMGLPIVRALIEAQEGAIRLLPSDGGAAFEIVLPLAEG